jgi:hypothetical protein
MTAATLLLWIDRADIATAPNIPLTAAVVAGNDYGNTTTLDRQEPTLLLLEYTFDRRRRRRWQ